MSWQYEVVSEFTSDALKSTLNEMSRAGWEVVSAQIVREPPSGSFVTGQAGGGSSGYTQWVALMKRDLQKYTP